MVLSDWGIFAQRYKYMRIYLWSALRIMVLRKRGGVDGLMPD
jgi:hypothetical protein